MPKIPLIQPPYPSLHSLISSENSESLVDGWIDEKGGLHRRSGLHKWATILSDPDDAGKGCQGIFYWSKKRTVVVVVDGRIFVNPTGTSTAWTEITSVMNKLHPTNPVTFSASADWLLVANAEEGKSAMYWNGDLNTPPAYFSDAGAPMAITKLAYIDTYFIASVLGSSIWYYTTAASVSAITPPIWTPVGLTADGNPDGIRSLAVGWREVMLAGDQSTEIWFNNGAALPDPPFARMDGAYIEQGISAPYSLVNINNTWMWLNHQKEIILLIGRDPKVVSGPIRNNLLSLRNVADARAFKYDRFYCITFPSENITWSMDAVTGVWYQWAKWEPEAKVYDRWLVNDVCFVEKWGVWMGCCHKDSRIFILHPDVCTDDGEVLRMRYRSGHLDSGTYKRKISSELILKLTRGVTAQPLNELLTFISEN